MTFSDLKLSPETLTALSRQGYSEPTPIQARAIPIVLAGKDAMAAAQTGTGKTTAFTAPILELLKGNERAKANTARVLILTPTRELAAQVGENVANLSAGLPLNYAVAFGGVKINPQMMKLRKGVDILVATPGRLLDLCKQNAVRFPKLEVLVLDEADRMLDMGFAEVLDAIVAETPEERQTLLFSATFADGVRPIAERMLRDPVSIEVASTHDDSSIRQLFHRVADDEARFEALRILLLKYRPESSVVFCNTKRQAQEVSDALNEHGFSAMALHGDLEQRERDQTLVMFANKSTSILVATDVAARGLDIEALDAVFNYEIARDLDAHVHRVGRTGRAGSSGIACTLYTEKEDYRLTKLGEFLEQTLEVEPLPSKSMLTREPFHARMATLQIDGGKKDKLRPGDILGALTGDGGLEGSKIGKIKVLARTTFLAVERDVAKSALTQLMNGKLKGRSFRARRLKS